MNVCCAGFWLLIDGNIVVTECVGIRGEANCVKGNDLMDNMEE